MKALVLSGGSGARLRPITYSMPKQLIPVANRPILEYVLENIRDIGVTDTAIVVGDRAAQIVSALGDGSRFGMRITYIKQPQPLGLAHAVQIARDHLGDDDFVMYLADNILPDGIADMARQFRDEPAAAQVVVQKVADPRAFGVAELGPDRTVLRLVEKPRIPRSDLALIGVYFFSPAIHQAVTAIEPSARGELEITDAIQWLLTSGARVTASRYESYWKDAGELVDVLDCNRVLLSRMGRGVVTHPGSRVSRSTIEGPAIIGPNAVIEDCHIGPYTAIGASAVLQGVGIADSIVLQDTLLSKAGGLRGVLAGPRATMRIAQAAIPVQELGANARATARAAS